MAMLRIIIEILENYFFNIEKNKTREYLWIWLAFINKKFLY